MMSTKRSSELLIKKVNKSTSMTIGGIGHGFIHVIVKGQTGGFTPFDKFIYHYTLWGFTIVDGVKLHIICQTYKMVMLENRLNSIYKYRKN